MCNQDPKKEQKDSQHLEREGFPRIDERQNAQTVDAKEVGDHW